jgi:putative peptidoglycan lipid II flippase
MEEPTFDALDGEAIEQVAAQESTGSGSGPSTTRALATAGIIVTAASLLSRILGFVRLVVIARAVPDTAALDAFYQAFSIPDFLFQLVAAGALASALVPVIAALFARGESTRAWRVISTVTTLILGALLVLVVLAEVAAAQLVGFISPGFHGPQLDEAVRLTRLMLLGPLFLAGGAVASAALNARGRFTAAAVAPLVYNVGIIAGAVLLVPLMGTEGLAAGVVLGAAGLLVVQVPGMLSIGARVAPSLDLSDEPTRRALVLMLPRTVGLGATQIVFMVMKALATTLPQGSVTAFMNGFTLLQIPIGVIGVPLGTVLLPSMSREAALGNHDGFRRLLVRGISLLAYAMIAISALGIPLAGDVTRVAYGLSGLPRDVMGWIALSLAVFMVGLTAHSVIAVLARAFYALQDTATPVMAGIISVAVNIAVGVVLVGPLGLAGLAVAIAVGAWLEVVVLLVLLERRAPGLHLGRLGRDVALTLAAAVPGALVAWGLDAALGAYSAAPGGTLVSLGRLALATAAGGTVVLGASLALRIEEPRRILGIVLDLTHRRGRA